MTLTLLVFLLYVLGGVLTLYGLFGATRKARRRHAYLDDRLQQLDAIDEDAAAKEAALGNVSTPAHRALAEETQRRKDAVMTSTTGWNHLTYAREYAERDFLGHLARPAWTAGAGVLLGTLGSCLSLLL